MDSNDLGKARTGIILMGIGLGGLIDGTVLHQILQWHNMLSSKLHPDTMPAMKTNMAADGYFHAFCILALLVGLFLLWGAAYRRTVFPESRWFIGLLIFGWGLFNLVEGIIDHHLLGLHHVRYEGDMMWDRPSAAWDWGFLLIGGVGLIALGWFLAKSATRPDPTPVRDV
jgi:uncharacterized membrane protein